MFRNNFPGFYCWGYLIEIISKLVLCLIIPARKKCEPVFLFNTKIPAPLQVGDFVLVRGTDKGYIEFLNEYNYATVWFIIGRNKYIVQ